MITAIVVLLLLAVIFGLFGAAVETELVSLKNGQAHKISCFGFLISTLMVIILAFVEWIIYINS